MPIFKHEGEKLITLKTIPFSKEKELQNLIEKNLFRVLEMYFLATEYRITSERRIDTLAVDVYGIPVIIEYKLNEDKNVITQAMSYMHWLKKQKVDFFENLVKKNLDKDIADKLKIDWKNPRIICIAKDYSESDIDAAKEISTRFEGFELFKYHYYENGILRLDPVNTRKQTKTKKEATKEPYISHDPVNIETHLTKVQHVIQQIFKELRTRILEIDEDIIEKTTSANITYRLSKNFAELQLNKQRIRILLRPINYGDPLHKVEKVPDTHRWTLDRRIYVENFDDIDYVMKLIKQSYEDVV